MAQWVVAEVLPWAGIMVSLLTFFNQEKIRLKKKKRKKNLNPALMESQLFGRRCSLLSQGWVGWCAQNQNPHSAPGQVTQVYPLWPGL